eukprot:6290232-Prymnesium_polylepis.1
MSRIWGMRAPSPWCTLSAPTFGSSTSGFAREAACGGQSSGRVLSIVCTTRRKPTQRLETYCWERVPRPRAWRPRRRAVLTGHSLTSDVVQP